MHYLISIVSLYNNFYSLCGAKGSRDFGLFHIKPKAHAEEEEMPEDEQRESKQPGYTIEDDLVLGRPKSRKGKVPCRQRQSPRASQGSSEPNRPAIGS